jgi:polar amino acid transport system substrate-binding protein
VRIAVKSRAAYDLFLQNNLKHAELIKADTIEASLDMFLDNKLDAIAGLRPGLSDWLLRETERLHGCQILDGGFDSVKQSVGTPKHERKGVGAAWLRSFVEDAKDSGFIGSLLDTHGQHGKLSVAPPAQST